MGHLRDAAVHNTAQPEPKPENSNGVGPHSVARVPSAAQLPPRPRASNKEGPPSERCRTQHSPAGTEARELKRGRATFGMLPYATQPGRNRSPRTQTGSGHIRSRGYLLQPSRPQGLELQTRKGRLQNAAVHNTAQLEPKHENSDGDGLLSEHRRTQHSPAGAKARELKRGRATFGHAGPSAAQPDPRSRASNKEGPPSGFCHTQHSPAGTKARELRRRWAAFRTLPYATRPSWNQSPRAQTGSGHIRARGLGAAATPRRPRCLPRG